VNSTFYGQPRAKITQAWADRTPAGFEFAVKLFQKFTHPAMFREARRRCAGASDDALAAAGDASGRRGRVAGIERWRSPQPGPLLVQFPPSFHGAAGVDYLGCCAPSPTTR
jgi:uncharacterized protein YecE (DUF72 family)